MTRLLRLAAAIVVLAAAGSAAAQQQPQQRSQVGFGISIVPIDAAGALPTIELYAPIAIAPNFRLEPSIGILTDRPAGGGAERSDVTLGIGAFVVDRAAAALDIYAGGRLKLNFASIDDGPFDDSDTDVILAAALGGEYYLVPRFSIGAEAQLGLYSLGDVSGDGSGFFTTGLAFLRVYF